jgi:hypothetical protein
MRKEFFALGIAICLMAGCSHYPGGYGEDSTSANALSCDTYPLNQPGCHDRYPNMKELIDRFDNFVRGRS